MIKRKVEQREKQRAYMHALSCRGSHICGEERRPGNAPAYRGFTTESWPFHVSAVQKRSGSTREPCRIQAENTPALLPHCRLTGK